MPANFCENCLENLNSCHTFRTDLIENQKRLKEWLKPKKPLLNETQNEIPSENDTSENSIIPTNNSNEISLYTESQLKCEKCILTFNSAYKFNAHVNKHPLDKKITCSECNKMFLSKKAFEKHFHFVHSEGALKTCPYCKKNFKNSKSLSNHIVRHNPERRKKCQFCSKSFFPGDLNRHLRTHNSEKPYMCNICGNCYSQAYALTEHMRKHKGGNIEHECDKCKEKFANKALLRIHEVKCKNKKLRAKSTYKCHILHCTSNFDSRKNLKKHLETNHNLTITNFEKTCLECNKTFENIGEYSVHIKTHSCNYVCHICKIRFKTFENLERHESKHENDQVVRKFRCEECEAIFKTAAHLKQHVAFKHTTNRKYQCNFCDLKFKYMGELRSHIIIHTNIRPYSCPFCSSSFRKSSTLRTHCESVHNSSFIYKCECLQSFRYAHEYKAHKSESGHGNLKSSSKLIVSEKIEALETNENKN